MLTFSANFIVAKGLEDDMSNVRFRRALSVVGRNCRGFGCRAENLILPSILVSRSPTRIACTEQEYSNCFEFFEYIVN